MHLEHSEWIVMEIGSRNPKRGQEMKGGFIAVVLWLISLQGCATVYSAKETYAQVVDAETNEPLEGVIVVAHWVLDYASSPLAMHAEHADWMLMETVTDSNGQFRFPAWGPKAVRPEFPPFTRLAGQDPEVILFKSGYEWQARSNGVTGPPEWPGPLVRSWGGNGKTIRMKKFKGGLKEYGRYIGGVLTGVDYGRCDWKKIPRIIIALNEEDERLRRLGIFTVWSSPITPTIADLKANADQDHCGSVSDFLKDYRK
jgi:hypothetical protein